MGNTRCLFCQFSGTRLEVVEHAWSAHRQLGPYWALLCVSKSSTDS
jgi:hypothetical protein